MKALITELIWREGIEELKNQGFEVDYDETLWNDRERLLQVLPLYDAVIVRNQTIVDEELMEAGTRIKAIGRLGVGLDNIDVKRAKEKDIPVVFARHANATSVAEYVLTAILSSSRPLHLASSDVRNGQWNRKKYTGGELYQKTLGLIGLGEISHRVAKRANAFGMNIIGYDPFITEYDHVVSETGVDVKETLQELLVESDFISLHVPLSPSTQHLLSTAELNRMKPSSYVINTSRGGIIDEQALASALQNQQIAGAYLDVLEREPILGSHPLLLCENVTITPHIAGLTEESQVRTSFLVAKEIGKVLKGERSLCTV
ncbi:hydroxyacid dehydrogenase [Rossellomorea aquimaris]|jgi:D-3-phosphoglycerate dehydrogenase|uniref:hydroxyacid dehydrogenase n=1 Tax=Rossellomorea aquimaris TaxID=189382 RepID=UPI0011E9309C|nr:hydroxyacid dehydrogenase [Rossellomorea aquimaris]TYS89384.1 hydroxyacid dehydrogenase [Rossellomorea aquimaris]